jgi:hypothetical protein
MRRAPTTFEARQAQLNAMQTAVTKAQRVLSAQRRAAAQHKAPEKR